MVAPAQQADAPAAKPWPAPLRLLFRFVFCYYLLYAAPAHGTANLLAALPGTSWISGPYMRMWDAIVTWVAVHPFHLVGDYTRRFPTGSGDTTLDYIEVLCNITLSFVVMLVWSVLDRRRREYTTLHAWLRVLVRYMLAVTLFGYGFAKVFPLQFRTPPLARLLEPYGEFSPMGALWWFMGASTGYIIFSGTMEVLGGLLLMFRRTATLGAMVSFAVLSNVVALNYFYDVPVKLYSTNLLLMGVFLMAPDLRRLCSVLVLNRPAPPADLSRAQFQNRKLRIVAAVLPVLFFGYVLFNEVKGGWQSYQARLHTPRSPLYGAYNVETFTRNGLELGTDKTRWRKIVLESPTGATVRTMDDTVINFGAKYDAAKQILALTQMKTQPSTLAWTTPDADHVVLSGKLGQNTVAIILRRIDPKSFLLLNRGYHWINERPLNR
jgi:hypothetical protein